MPCHTLAHTHTQSAGGGGASSRYYAQSWNCNEIACNNNTVRPLYRCCWLVYTLLCYKRLYTAVTGIALEYNVTRECSVVQVNVFSKRSRLPNMTTRYKPRDMKRFRQTEYNVDRPILKLERTGVTVNLRVRRRKGILSYKTTGQKKPFTSNNYRVIFRV